MRFNHCNVGAAYSGKGCQAEATQRVEVSDSQGRGGVSHMCLFHATQTRKDRGFVNVGVRPLVPR